MKSLSCLCRMIATSCAVVALAGCVAQPARRGGDYAPPPRKPAAGYHQMYRGNDIRYDAGLGVYVLMDLPNLFFFNNHYYRYHEGRWYYSRELNGKWRKYNERRLPPGLRKKYSHEKHSKHRKPDDHERY